MYEATIVVLKKSHKSWWLHYSMLAADTTAMEFVQSCSNCHQEQDSSQVAEEKLDIDEDRENPAYIPRKGEFYLHDMRIEADSETADKTEYVISFHAVLCRTKYRTDRGTDTYMQHLYTLFLYCHIVFAK